VYTVLLREWHRLNVFENKVLRRIFGAKIEEVTRRWRQFQNEELCKLYTPDQILSCRNGGIK
jgi:hypothetical protein